MGIILLDDDFYNEEVSNKYIKDLLDFIENHLELDVSVFHPFCNVGKTWACQNMLATIQLKIQKTGKLEIFDNNLITPINDLLYNDLSFSSDFIGQINYLLKNFDDVIIPVVESKHKLDIKLPSKNVYIINHIYKETNSNIAYFILNNIFVTNVKKPHIDSPLSNFDLCNQYYDLQKTLIKEGKDTLKIYSEIAKEVANRNCYTYNPNVSKKNTCKSKNKKKNKREIYDFDNKLYISTDFESGCFEFYNSRGKHQGEYSYTNNKISSPDTSGKHDIIV